MAAPRLDAAWSDSQWLRLPLWNTVVVYNNSGARGPWYPRLAYGYPVECILPRSSYDSRPEPVITRLGKELPAGFTEGLYRNYRVCKKSSKFQNFILVLGLRKNDVYDFSGFFLRKNGPDIWESRVRLPGNLE